MNLSESYKSRLKELAGIKEGRNEVNDEFVSEFGDMEKITSSRNGIVFRKKPGVIVKVTKDKSEFDNAVKFLNKPHKNFVKYFSAQPWKEISGNQFYVLEMEDVNELTDKEWDIIDLIQNSLGRQDYMLDDKKRYAFLNELKRNSEWYEEIGSYKEVVKILMNLYSMYRDAERRGFVLYDLRAQNIGRTIDGRLVHFDIGDEY